MASHMTSLNYIPYLFHPGFFFILLIQSGKADSHLIMVMFHHTEKKN